MGIEELLKIKRKEILQIVARHGAKNVRVFGSVARGEAGPESDVDFLVEFESERSLLTGWHYKKSWSDFSAGRSTFSPNPPFIGFCAAES